MAKRAVRDVIADLYTEIKGHDERIAQLSFELARLTKVVTDAEEEDVCNAAQNTLKEYPPPFLGKNIEYSLKPPLGSRTSKLYGYE